MSTKTTHTPPPDTAQTKENVVTCHNLIDAARALTQVRQQGGSGKKGPLPLLPDNHVFPLLDHVGAKFSLAKNEQALLFLLAIQEIDSARRQPGTPGALSHVGCLADFHHLFPDWGDARMLLPSRPLRRWNLIELITSRIDPQPLVHTRLRISERILSFLLGDTSPDERLAAALNFNPPRPVLTPAQAAVAREIAGHWQNVPHFGAFPSLALRGGDADALKATAWEAARIAGFSMAGLDALSLPDTPEERRAWLLLWETEALLNESALYFDAFNLDSRNATSATEWFTHCGGAVLLGHRDTLRLPHQVKTFEAPETQTADREQLILAALNGKAPDHGDFAQRLAGQFDLGANALYEACIEINGTGDSKDSTDIEAAENRLWEACRKRSRPRLGGLVQLIESKVTWEDLILPEDQTALLRQAVSQVQGRGTVHNTWGFASKTKRGLSMTALLSGPSGTGKTLAAEVMANDLRLDLLRVDLSSVVSKYIGETEKHLNEIFDAAETGGAVLLFDEADALFGPRSKVNDSRDRNANIEVSFLLQRLECFRGLALLTTNLKENLDHAFLRRIRFHVEFPFPDRLTREKLWRHAFPPETPLDKIRFDRLCRLSLTGGNIRNICINAAFQANAARSPVRMEHIAAAARNEFRKAEKPVPEGELKALLRTT